MKKNTSTNKRKYIVVDESVDFRSIAKIMTKNGFKMNHATARNVLIAAIKKIMSYSAEQVGVKMTPEIMTKMIKDQNLHSALADVLFRAHRQQSDKVKKKKESIDI